MKEIAIICLLPEEVNRYYKELRQKIGDQFGLDMKRNIPAHITVKYGFPVENVDEIEKMAEEFCMSETGRAKWTLRDFGRFVNPDKYVVFIEAVPSTETRKAHARFLDKLRQINWVQWGPYDNINLHYHVTLAVRGITSENHEAVWSFVNQQKKPKFAVHFDNLALVEIEEDSGSVYKTFSFPSTKAG